MGEFYAQLLDAKGWMLGESAARHTLSVLRSPPLDVAVSDILHLGVMLENASEDNRLILQNAVRELKRSQQLGVKAGHFDPALFARFCNPHP